MRALLFALALVCASTARADDVDDIDPQVRALLDRVLASYGYHRGPSPRDHWGRVEVDGRDDVVIIVEPIEGAARRELADSGAKGLPDVMWWDESRPTRLARAFPLGRFTLHNPVAESVDFDIFRGKKLWRRVTVGAHADLMVDDLPEGVLRVRRVGGDVDGWVYVTPWPSRVMHRERHATFNVPNGRYKLRGWHPRGGERSVVVVAN